MRNYILAVAASALFAAPAFAGESRAEVHGGVFFGPNYSTEAVVGVAAGHDFDLGSSTFAGVEASADKILLGDTRVVIGGTLRFGVKTEEGGRAYLTGLEPKSKTMDATSPASSKSPSTPAKVLAPDHNPLLARLHAPSGAPPRVADWTYLPTSDAPGASMTTSFLPGRSSSARSNATSSSRRARAGSRRARWARPRAR